MKVLCLADMRNCQHFDKCACLVFSSIKLACNKLKFELLSALVIVKLGKVSTKRCNYNLVCENLSLKLVRL